MIVLARIYVPFVVDKQHIIQPTRESLVSGGQNYFYATFTTNDTWGDISDIKAVFVTENMSKLIPLTKTETGYECQIPWEVMTNKGIFHVGIFGGDRLLTNYAYVTVKQGCMTDGEEPTPPTPDWFDKVDKEIAHLESSKLDKSEVCSKEDMEQYVEEQTEIIRSDVEGIQNQIEQESHFRGYFSTNAELQSSSGTPNDFAYSAESGTMWIYDFAPHEDDPNRYAWIDTSVPVPDQLTPASNTTPLINGVASAGKESAYARGDHRHPTDTTRVGVAEFNYYKQEVLNMFSADNPLFAEAVQACFPDADTMTFPLGNVSEVSAE